MLCLEQNAVDGMNIHGWVTLVRTAGKEEGSCPIWAKPNREPACKSPYSASQGGLHRDDQGDERS